MVIRTLEWPLMADFRRSRQAALGRLLPFASGGVDQVSLTFDDFQVVKIVLHRGRATDYRKDALYI